MATANLTTTSSTVVHAAGSHVQVRNTGPRDAILTCRGVTYRVSTVDRDGGVSIPARGAAVTGLTETGTTSLDVTVVDLADTVDGGPL